MIEDSSLTTGTRFFVHSSGTDAATGGLTPEDPLASLAYAISLCTNNKNNWIYLMPGHTENVGSAGAINCNKTGVTIVGLGNGSDRATFTWTTTASTWTVTAANVTIKNINTAVSIDEVVSMFSVSAANVTFDSVNFRAVGTSTQAIQWLLTTAAADNLTIQNCQHYQLTAAAAAQKWIELVGTDFTRIVDNTFFIVANASTSSSLIAGSTAVVYCEIARNNCLFIGATIDKVINLVTTSTGLIANNNIGSGTSVATASAITGDACFMFDNKWADTAAASGLLAPVVDTDT
jgi:hypothetical protein